MKHTTKDYDRIRRYVRLFDPDILVDQEVDGEAVLSRVVDTTIDRVQWCPTRIGQADQVAAEGRSSSHASQSS